jgi:hypothetical protein
MKNTTHVLNVINTYVSIALIQFILVLTLPDPVVQLYITNASFVGKYMGVMLRFKFAINVQSY